jgi:hypothetical protein
MNQCRQIVVLVVDRLGAGWLAPYGNTYVGTPHLDRLASQSLLAEFMIGDGLDLAATYRSYLHGVPPPVPLSALIGPLPNLARQQGWSTQFVTDDASLAHDPLVESFGEPALVTWEKPATMARDVARTRTSELLAAGLDLLPESGSNLLWIHAGGLNQAWDAPLELRERFVDDDEPPPSEGTTPAQAILAAHHDPDEVLPFIHAYAAEVSAFDAALGGFLDRLDREHDPAETLLIVTGPRGYALGEHLGVGAPGDALRGEILQTPLIVRFPGSRHRLTRLGGMHQPVDVFATLAAALQLPQRGWGVDVAAVANAEARSRPWAAVASAGELALRTPAWSYRETMVGDVLQQLVYAKPDDRWEVNEVAARVPEVVAAFEQLRDALRPAWQSMEPPALPDLPELLTRTHR